MKPCKTCGELKPLSEYYKHPGALDGHRGICKACVAPGRAAYYQGHKTEYAERQRRNRQDNPELYRALHQRWERHNRERRNEISRLFRARSPERGRAHRALQTAVANGVVFRPDSCKSCAKDGTPEGHHSDYTRPLCVEWLCTKCHNRRHVGIKEDLALMSVGLDAA